MATITNQKEAREVQKLEFCFLCGRSFCEESSELKKTLDHVPPQTIFAASDKTFPLKIPAHWKCNNDWSKRDDVVAELISVVHGDRKQPKKSALAFKLNNDALTGESLVGVSGVNIERHVIRWVQGCHASLYREYIPEQSTKFCISLPMPRLLNGPRAAALMRRLQTNHINFVEVIKKNRKAGRLDRIHCNNGKFTFECVWAKTDDERECCIFALQLYDWQRLGPINRPRSSCVGLYLPEKGRPTLGTQEVTIEIPLLNAEPFDAFC
jgi:hypothetical protein